MDIPINRCLSAVLVTVVLSAGTLTTAVAQEADWTNVSFSDAPTPPGVTPPFDLITHPDMLVRSRTVQIDLETLKTKLLRSVEEQVGLSFELFPDVKPKFSNPGIIDHLIDQALLPRRETGAWNWHAQWLADDAPEGEEHILGDASLTITLANGIDYGYDTLHGSFLAQGSQFLIRPLLGQIHGIYELQAPARQESEPFLPSPPLLAAPDGGEPPRGSSSVWWWVAAAVAVLGGSAGFLWWRGRS